MYTDLYLSSRIVLLVLSGKPSSVVAFLALARQLTSLSTVSSLGAIRSPVKARFLQPFFFPLQNNTSPSEVYDTTYHISTCSMPLPSPLAASHVCTAYLIASDLSSRTSLRCFRPL